ncbi:MAG TPA: hypothetical protein VEW93_06440 [Acidimicrobiales bacterium]|nr:hypothetical protein [Acidimicrobiales bacterium]
MTLHRSARRAVAAAFALTLLVAACGGDDDASDDTPDTTATTATTAGGDSSTTATTEDGGSTTETTAAEGPDDEEAEALAESINLTIEDFADGWEEEPAEDDDDEEDELDACFEDVSIEDVELASVESPTFSVSTDDGSQGQVVQTSTIVVDEEASGEAIVAEIGTNQFAGCAEDALITSFEEDGGEITGSGLDPVDDQGGLGDESVGIAGAISFTSPDGTEADGQVALYFIRTENVVTAMSLFDFGDLAYEDTLADLLEAVANRQAENV